MSLPDSAEYWWDVQAHFQRKQSHEVRFHAIAQGCSPEKSLVPTHTTVCGLQMPVLRCRSKRSKVTCRACLAKLHRFTITHVVSGLIHIFASSDQVLEAQEKYFEATDKGLQDVILQDRMRSSA